jgi:MerR family transcriptional regulator, redox-sensitive transcriptional activator SoxR
MEPATLTIGEVARQVGLNTSAIRYYERMGVLPEPERASGQRRYTPETIRQLQVIDIAKRAGFTLDDARLLLAPSDGGEPAYAQLRELALRKLPEVDALITRAQAMRAWLVTASGCTCTTLDICALFEPGGAQPAEPDAPPAPQITHVDGCTQTAAADAHASPG